MLSFEDKRSILLSYRELKETEISNQRYNYELRFPTSGRRVVASEFAHTGNGYVLATDESTHPVDARGWINVKELSENELRLLIRHAINTLRKDALNHQVNAFLTDAELLPLDLWRTFELGHHAPASPGEVHSVKQMIAAEVGDANGLYVYTTTTGQVLYVGKAKPLNARLWSHYLESFQTVKGDTKDNRWHRFFSSHQGRVTIHWTELEDENNRKLIEQMLTMKLRPAFLNFK